MAVILVVGWFLLAAFFPLMCAVEMRMQHNARVRHFRRLADERRK